MARDRPKPDVKQIDPIRIIGLDQRKFPIALPFLHELFAGDGLFDLIMALGVNQPRLCEVRNALGAGVIAILMNAANQQTAQLRNVHPLPTAEKSPFPTPGSADGHKLDLNPITAPHGDVTFIALGETEVAIRNAAIEPLIEAVRGTVKGRGRWQPLFKNWIVKREDFAAVKREIEARLAEPGDRRLA